MSYIAQAHALHQSTPSERLEKVLDLYNKEYLSDAARMNLETYVASEQFETDAKTVRIYSNCHPDDTKRILLQREPVNIKMNYLREKKVDRFDESKLSELTGGYKRSVFSDDTATTQAGKKFCDTPNSVSIYSETTMWDTNTIWEKGTRRIACLSLSVPTLDTPRQPHYSYYVQNDILNTDRYETEMTHLATTIMQVLLEHKAIAFEGKGIKRCVLSAYGQGGFLTALTRDEAEKASALFQQTLEKVIRSNKDSLQDLPIVIIDFSVFSTQSLVKNIGIKNLSKDIRFVAEEGDFIVNACNPHSFPGNPSESEKSLDAALGSSTAILATQCGWINPRVIDVTNFRQVEKSTGCILL